MGLGAAAALVTQTEPTNSAARNAPAQPDREPRSAGLWPASSAGVPPVETSGGGTPPEPAAKDGCATRFTVASPVSRIAGAADALGRVFNRTDICSLTRGRL
jgi:hypothetical protein